MIFRSIICGLIGFGMYYFTVEDGGPPTYEINQWMLYGVAMLVFAVLAAGHQIIEKLSTLIDEQRETNTLLNTLTGVDRNIKREYY